MTNGNVFQTAWLLSISDLAQDEETSQILAQKLKTFLDENPLQENTGFAFDENYASAVYNLYKGDIDEGLADMEKLADSGAVYAYLTTDPYFTPYADHPKYNELIKKFEAIRNKHRPVIEARLAEIRASKTE